jgi:hypothetical protein
MSIDLAEDEQEYLIRVLTQHIEDNANIPHELTGGPYQARDAAHFEECRRTFWLRTDVRALNKLNSTAADDLWAKVKYELMEE